MLDCKLSKEESEFLADRFAEARNVIEFGTSCCSILACKYAKENVYLFEEDQKRAEKIKEECEALRTPIQPLVARIPRGPVTVHGVTHSVMHLHGAFDGRDQRNCDLIVYNAQMGPTWLLNAMVKGAMFADFIVVNFDEHILSDCMHFLDIIGQEGHAAILRRKPTFNINVVKDVLFRQETAY